MFMKGQGESIIEDDDKGEDPDVVTDKPGEILFHYETQLPNNEASLQISLLSFCQHCLNCLGIKPLLLDSCTMVT